MRPRPWWLLLAVARSEGNVYEYKPAPSPINLGVDIMPIVHAPAEDRNRTSPFPYGGSRFEFRACGSSQVRCCTGGTFVRFFPIAPAARRPRPRA